MHECNMVTLRELLCPSDKRAGGRAAEKRDELPPFHLPPVGAEKRLRGYQLPALTASLCCIAKRGMGDDSCCHFQTKTRALTRARRRSHVPSKAAAIHSVAPHP